MIIGLTGSSGSGKTTAAEAFAEMGFAHIDSDKIAREVTCAGSACLNEIADAFGSDMLTSDGELNRRALGEVVFRDSCKLKTLNAITHKYILEAIENKISAAMGDVLIDAPLLFEANLHKRCDCTVAVIANKATQIQRIAERDGISAETAEKRLEKQHSNEFFIENCDYILENNSNATQLAEETKKLIIKLRGEGK